MPFSCCRLIIITTVYFCPLTLTLKVCPHTHLITDMAEERDFRRGELPEKFMAKMLYEWDDKKLERNW